MTSIQDRPVLKTKIYGHMVPGPNQISDLEREGMKSEDLLR